MIKAIQTRSDLGTYEKLYRLLRIRAKLIFNLIMAQKEFDAILKFKSSIIKKQFINVEEPMTFDDKLWYMKKHFYSHLAARCADKVSVRDYAAECGLKEILVPICGVYSSLNEVDFSGLPDECYIKCSHTSGYNYLYRKGVTDEAWLKKLFALYLKNNQYDTTREWVYRDIPHRIIIEKKCENKDGSPLLDYRMFCFDGKLKLVMVNAGTATEQGEHAEGVRRSFYTPEFEAIPELSILGDAAGNTICSKPMGWDKMADIARRLSSPFAFCRVDLYNIDGKVYLSEMTFFPNSGVNLIKPEEWALKMGKWIDLEKCKENPLYEYKE